MSTSETGATPWWQSAVIYQIYPRSFADGNGDGVGDLPGLRARIDHLAWLGVDALWLSPVYRSPMADFGYDVADHCAVDPVFGELADLDALVAAAHARGIRLLLDWVPNHTSDRHPWFVDSRSSRSATRRDWYVWRDGVDGEPPNNWRAAFGGRAWTWDERTAQWYLHLFLPQQPDLDWNHPDVVRAQHDVLRFWLDRGVDGFRADVVHLIGKDRDLPDQPDHLAHVDLVGVHDHPRSHDLLQGIRRVLDAYPGERVMVGEVNLPGAAKLAPYYGDGDELHLVFNFALVHAGWDAQQWAEVIEDAERAFTPVGGWPVWVLSNHDQSRHRSRFGGSEDRARVAAVVLLTLRGTPFLYAGEELGLLDATVPDDRRVDPGGRDACRAPIPWTVADGHGWDAEPWLPWPPDAGSRNVEAQRADPDSILHLYRRLLARRRTSPALSLGSWRLLDAPSGVLHFERSHGGERRRTVANFTAAAVEVVPADEGWVVEVATDRRHEGRVWNGTVGGDEAVVIRPSAD
jgi:alpha-glucosidase